MNYARVGAVFYVLWGLLHLIVAKKVFMQGQILESGFIQGRIYQDAFYLLFFAMFVIVVAIIFNRKNSKSGYWLNLVVVSAADIGFIIAVLIPGYIPIFPGIIGPALWLIALTLTTIGLFRNNTRKIKTGNEL
jgi:hypothetical protein